VTQDNQNGLYEEEKFPKSNFNNTRTKLDVIYEADEMNVPKPQLQRQQKKWKARDDKKLMAKVPSDIKNIFGWN